jgi:hypothetical protein
MSISPLEWNAEISRQESANWERELAENSAESLKCCQASEIPASSSKEERKRARQGPLKAPSFPCRARDSVALPKQRNLNFRVNHSRQAFAIPFGDSRGRQSE